MRVYVAAFSEYIRRVCGLYPSHCGVMQTTHTGNNSLNIARSGIPWVADNGFFSRPDVDKFKTFACNIAGLPNLEWVAVPDVVGSARETCKSWYSWEGWLKGLRLPLAFVLQDGITYKYVPYARCYFIGGSTAFKLSPDTALLCEQLKKRGALIHMGRVNTAKRLAYAHSIGCDSVDGSSMARWSKTYLEWACKICVYLDAIETKEFGGIGKEKHEMPDLPPPVRSA